MKNIIKPTLVLLIICITAGFVLALLYHHTEPIIVNNIIKQEQLARKEVLPGASEFVPFVENEKTLFYQGYNSDSTLIGFTFKAKNYGYSSEIKTVIGVNVDLITTGIKIVAQQETPGLGAKCSNLSFAQKFIKTNPTSIYVKKDGGDIEAITGATITTRAVTNSIREKFLELKDIFKNIVSKEQS